MNTATKETQAAAPTADEASLPNKAADETQPLCAPTASDNAYRDTVYQLAESDSPDIFSNGLPEHAAIIFEVFFKKAKKTVNIFCENLNPRVFSSKPLIEAFEEALKRGVNIRILSQNTPLPGKFSGKMDEWTSTFKDNLQSKVAPSESFIKTMNENFSVMDSKAFRFEPLRGDGKASASMNGPGAAQRFDKVFETLFSAA